MCTGCPSLCHHVNAYSNRIRVSTTNVCVLVHDAISGGEMILLYEGVEKARCGQAYDRLISTLDWLWRLLKYVFVYLGTYMRFYVCICEN